jgi:membrane associated rhomboid family serine protease
MIPLFDRAGRRQRWPLMTLLLVAVNVAVFAYEISLPAQALTCLIHDYSAIPHDLALHVGQPSDPACPEYATPEPFVLPLISSLFIHAGWLHIAGNMLFLLIFGDNVEDRLGHLGFLLFYLLCGLAGVVAQTLADPTSALPIIGASGAIAGVLGAYLVLFPLARVRTLVLIIPIDLPAWLLIGVWILVQALSGLADLGASSSATGAVAYFAHLGGFALGLVIALFYRWFAPSPSARAKRNSPTRSS